MIVELLEAHDAAPFPAECRGAEIAAVDLMVLDADVVGLATSYLAAGRLGEAQRLILEGCVTDAERVLPHLDSGARSYFVGVREIAAAVLEAVEGGDQGDGRAEVDDGGIDDAVHRIPPRTTS